MMISYMAGRFATGVLHGDEVTRLFRTAQDEGFAIPSMNVSGTNTVNAILETARALETVAMVQISFGGAEFFAGKSLSNDNWEASVAGAVAMAKYVHMMAEIYGVSAVVHSDHCPKEVLPWMDGMLAADEAWFKDTGTSLFSTHMLDLSIEPLKENIETCKRYLERMSAMGMTLELEIGITGGEEDGIDHSNANEAKLYTQPEDIAYAYEELMSISDKFSIAAAFGNVHGVYKPGNVKLRPEILKGHQDYVHEKFGTETDKPIVLVFHGGSGSEKEKITEAISYGAVKFNIDTDTQWAFWDGVRQYEAEHHDYLQGQIGNPEGEDKPNKKLYDPRKWLRAGEVAIVKRMTEAYEDLNSVGRNK